MSDHSHIGQLKPDPRNARKHTPRNVGTIVAALHEVGAARSIVIDENDVILAGNATVEAAGQAGIERVRVVEADGNEIIAVRRRGLSPKAKERLKLFDNQSSALAEWDEPVLAGMFEEDPSLFEGIFNDDERVALFEAAADNILFEPVGIEEQGRLDEKARVTCPECGHAFAP